MKKDEKPDTLAIIHNHNFCDKHTDRLYDQLGPEGRVGENATNKHLI